MKEVACKTKIKTDTNRGHVGYVQASVTVGLFGKCLEYLNTWRWRKRYKTKKTPTRPEGVWKYGIGHRQD